MSLQTVLVDSPTSALERAIASGWNPVCNITYNRDAWVNLLQAPSEYAFNEAKLICQEDSDHWIAWVPDHGEVVLDHCDFYC